MALMRQFVLRNRLRSRGFIGRRLWRFSVAAGRHATCFYPRPAATSEAGKGQRRPVTFVAGTSLMAPVSTKPSRSSSPILHLQKHPGRLPHPRLAGRQKDGRPHRPDAAPRMESPEHGRTARRSRRVWPRWHADDDHPDFWQAGVGRGRGIGAVASSRLHSRNRAHSRRDCQCGGRRACQSPGRRLDLPPHRPLTPRSLSSPPRSPV